MSEIDAILDAAADLRARGIPAALATVVTVRGSSYRRPGARLLVPQDGGPIGLISGGCLEEEAARLAGSSLPPTEFFDKLLNRTISAIDAPAGAVWLLSSAWRLASER